MFDDVTLEGSPGVSKNKLCPGILKIFCPERSKNIVSSEMPKEHSKS